MNNNEASKATSIRLTEQARIGVDQRGTPTQAINEGLERYYQLLARTRKAMENKFAAAELALIADSCNGTLFEAWSIPLLHANIEDAITLDRLNEKWGVEEELLLDKLKALTHVECHAMVDAVERFWKATARGETIEYADILK